MHEPEHNNFTVTKPSEPDLGTALVQAVASRDLIRIEKLALVLIQHYPQNPLGWKSLGGCLRQMGRISEALEPMQRAADLLPDDPEIHFNLGLLFHELNRPLESEISYKRALELKPDGDGIHNNLGTLFADLNRHTEAEFHYRSALKIKPDFVEAYNNLGITLRKSGHLEDAESCFRNALRFNSNFAEAQLSLAEVLHQIVGRNSGKAFFNHTQHAFEGVRMQYENLPFPARNPEADRFVITVSLPDILGKINQYCFNGSRDYSKPFRVLVAGCGTGDSVIWLAYQLKDTQAEIVAIDMSAASLGIAKERANIHQLRNITWINGSLLDLPTMGLRHFDYITCLGVLHHLPNPDTGLAALATVLAEDGAMAIMLYGTVGRSHIYYMQDLLRRLSSGLRAPGERLSFSKEVLANLPATNPFRKHLGMSAITDQFLLNETNFWDTLLHEQDRAYTASEVRQFLAKAGLNLVSFISYQGIGATTNLQYDLDLYIKDEGQRERLQALSRPEREDISEALDGSLSLHTVYATRSSTSSLSLTAPEAILSTMSKSAQKIISFLSNPTKTLPILLTNGKVVTYNPTPLTRQFLHLIDGYRDNSGIADLLGLHANSQELHSIYLELKLPAALHWLLARTAAGSHNSPLLDTNPLTLPLRHYEPTTLPL